MAHDWRDRRNAESFGGQAAAYERARPSYPTDAVAWLIGEARRVADVGAGTGKLTRVLAGLGREVVAVEPDDAMRAELEASVPGVSAVKGRGEHLPLADASVDAVTYGQAWHWVDPALASREAGRVLTETGALGLLWNVRDPSEGWVAALAEIVPPAPGEVMATSGEPPAGLPFCHAEERRWTWTRTVAPDDVLDMMTSRSHLITAPAAERTRILGGVRDLLDTTHPATTGRATVQVPYVTIAWRLTRG